MIASRSASRVDERYAWFLLATFVVALVNDGWSGRPIPLWKHQVVLLPIACVFWFALWRLLRPRSPQFSSGVTQNLPWVSLVSLALVGFELVSLLSFRYEARHFARFGYHAGSPMWAAIFGLVILAAVLGFSLRSAAATLTAVLLAYGSGLVLAIRCFPLNYLRSDMLPVILWADSRVVAHLNPYTTMHVGTRLYDFPYLPGMLVAYLPAVAARVDVRWINVICVMGLACAVFATAQVSRRRDAALLLGVFLLSPFMQYRHELYLAPHWLTLVAALALLARRQWVWAALLFGCSMALYQLSWVLLPFWLLYALRRGGFGNALRQATLTLGAMLALVAPFARAALGRIAHNTVGQWSQLAHALADPINLSYWLTFLVRPDQLQWVQLVLLGSLFACCIWQGRCRTLEDTLRWMTGALALFIALNVLVDGYFYLTLLLLMLVYTLVSTGIWTEPTASASAAQS